MPRVARSFASTTAPVLAAAGLLALIAAAPAARADGDQAFLGVFAETTTMKMAGMKMPEIHLPPGIKLPPQAQAALDRFKTGQRKLTVRLWSPSIAPNDATASLAIPDGLKLGPKLDLALYRPTPEEGTTGGGAPGTPGSVDTSFTIKRYWGSSATVKPGQPEVTEFGGLTPEQKAAMQSQASKMQSKSTYFYKPGWTTGYWPTDTQPGAIDDAAAMAGHYALTTTYTGNVAIDVPDNVNFLAPLEMSSPDLSSPINFDDAMAFKWAPVPNILGYHAMIFAMQQDKKKMILWDSSEIKPEFGLNYDYMQMSEVRDDVAKQLFMGPDRADVTVPAGIFKDCDMVMFTMIGYGPGTALDKAQPLPRVQTKTTLQIMLGGNKMPRGGFGRGGRGGGFGG